MDLNDVYVFNKVVQAGSFVGAARELDMPKSTVSRKVAELERRLGARLLQRTTRKLSLTDTGRTFHQHVLRAVSELESAEQAVSRMQETPRGLLRVTVPLNFGYLAPVLSAFLGRFPELRLEVFGTDRIVNLVEEGFDVAIRAGDLDDSSLVARRLGTLQSYVVASPDFLKRYGTPKQPEELAHFQCVVFAAGSERATWHLTRDQKTTQVKVLTRLLVNDFEFLADAARAGLGIATLPVFRCITDLRSKRLKRILPQWCAREYPLHAVYPSAQHLAPKVKALLDHLRDHMTPPPWERGPVPGL